MTEQQKLVLNENYRMVITQVDLIESVGGGSCRCMLVENWSTITPLMITNSKKSTKIYKKFTSSSSIAGDKFFTDVKSQNSKEKTNTNSNYSNNGEEIQNLESNLIITEFYEINRMNTENFFFQYDEQDLS